MSSLSSEGDYAIPPDACSLDSDYSEPEHKLQRTSAYSTDGVSTVHVWGGGGEHSTCVGWGRALGGVSLSRGCLGLSAHEGSRERGEEPRESREKEARVGFRDSCAQTPR